MKQPILIGNTNGLAFISSKTRKIDRKI